MNLPSGIQRAAAAVRKPLQLLLGPTFERVARAPVEPGYRDHTQFGVECGGTACNRDSDPCQDTVTGHLEAYAKGTGLDGGTLAALDVRVTKSSTERLAVGEHVTVPVASIAFDEGYPPDTVLLTGRPDPACAGVAEPWFNVGTPCFRACTVGFRFPDLGVSD
jgi:hypothetical protein